MGLDVYVGSLSRYYAGDWETIAQRLGREQGVPVEIIRRSGAEQDGPPLSPREAHAAILRWRAWLSQPLRAEGIDALDWDERLDAPYATDKPDWSGYGALLVWAAREEYPRWFARKMWNEKDWHKDRSYRRGLRAGVKSRYGQLIVGPEFWLPADFIGVIDATGPSGEETRIGSLIQLRRQLDLLNERTWRAEAAAIATWRRGADLDDRLLEDRARLGFAIFDHLTTFAIEHRLVMKLDY